MTLFDLLLFLFLFFSSFVGFLMLFYQTWRTHQVDADLGAPTGGKTADTPPRAAPRAD